MSLSTLIQLSKHFYIKYIDSRPSEYYSLYGHFLKGKRKILDAGCGVGNFIAIDPEHIEGIDQNSQSLEIAHKRGFVVQKGFVSRMHYKNGSFDGVFCGHVIEHLYPDELVSTLYEFDRILKKHGILVIVAPLFYSRFYNDATHIRPYPPESIFDYLRDTSQTATQRTARKKTVEFRLKYLSYRYDFLYYPSIEPSRFSSVLKRMLLYIGKVISMICYRIGIKNYFSKTGFAMVLEKI